MFSARWKVRPETAVDALERRTDAATQRAFRKVAEQVAETAKQTHPFQNRTGVLEESIHAGEVTGHLSDGTLHATVEADAPYASYVEDRPEFEFLALAFRLDAGELEAIVEAELDRIE